MTPIMPVNGKMNPDLYLHDGVIALRPYRPQDAEPMLAAVHESSDQVSPWLPALSTDMPLVEVTSYIAIQKHLSESGEAYNFVIQEHVGRKQYGGINAGDINVGGQILGGTGLTQINQRHRFANLYYWVRTSRTGEGIASRAVRLAARYAFVEAGLTRVEIVVAVENLASQRVAEKAGAHREGVLRKRIALPGKLHDAIVYSLIPEDFGLLPGGKS
jgi:ribosomal-protein-serine acetyltransferase